MDNKIEKPDVPIDHEVYVFPDQTKKQVNELIKQNENRCDLIISEMIKSQKNAEASYPTPKKPACLVGDWDVAVEYDAQPDIRKINTNDEENENICQLGSVWRKLSGVRPKEHVYEDKTVDNLLDKIIIALEKALPEIDFAWSDDRCYDQVLLVNKARTRFSTDPLVATYEVIKNLTGKEEAEEVIISIIKKKVCSLFI